MLKQELHHLISEFVAKYTNMGLEQFDGEELEPRRLASIIQAMPFLVTRRLVVLRQPSAQKALAEQLEKLLDAVPDTTDLIIVEPQLDKRTSYYKALQKKTEFKMFDELSEPTLAAWAVKYANQLNANLSRADATYLINRLGANQVCLAAEITKLASYEPQINRPNIDLLTDQLPQSNVFDLLEAAFAGRQAQAMAIYHDQRRQNVDPQAMLAMISWQLHIVAVVKAAGRRNPAEIASTAKINPYVVKKAILLSHKTPLAAVKRWVADAYDLDVRLKSQPIDPDEALQNYLLTLAA